MILLADNDIILKLARCDLLAEAVATLGSSFGEVCVLDTARFKLLPLKRGRGNIPSPSEPTCNRLKSFFDTVRVIDETPNPVELRALVDEFQIDAGEAVLFAVTASYPGCLLTTGDKRALVRLAGVGSTAAAVRDRLAGRVWGLEQILLRLITDHGFQYVLDRVVPARDCDRVLRLVFSASSTEQTVRDGLASYITDLRNETAGLLAP